MRKIFITSFLILLSVALISGSAYALSGQCSNCHTMHNSQNGTRMADRDTPYDNLLMATCIGCHTGPVATERKNSFGAPIVLGTVDPGGQGGTSTLAGGDFWWVKQGTANDALGHNVAGIASIDSKIGRKPPGWYAGATPGALSDGQINDGSDTWSTQLTCAGKYGCHGTHATTAVTPEAGIRGSHHSNTGLTATRAENATTVGGSYRFLGGINGLEHSNWNYNESASSHNEYFGENDTTNRNQGYTGYHNNRTISYSCAQCHGIFHSQIDDTSTGTPWLRHPTDIVLPSTAGKEYSAYTNYSIVAPVARPTVPTSSGPTVTAGDFNSDDGAIVMCLSCHRAHGSPEPDLLRWSYSGMIAGTTGGGATTGCFTCHTTKDGA